MLRRWFGLDELGTRPATEVRAGVVTFLTMSYILFVNPQILGQAGMPVADVVVATALAAAIASLVMGLAANYPFALAPGMGLNAYFAFGVVTAMGISWQVALAAVLVEGVLFLILSLSGARRALVEAIPLPIKLATTAGIGLFLAMIGFQNAGLVVDDAATLVGLGDLRQLPLLLALGGLVATAALLAAGVRGALLFGILGTTVLAWASGITDVPARFLSLPHLPRETFLAVDLSGLLDGSLVPVIVAFLFVDIFDTAGTLLGVGRLAGFVDDRGNLPRADRAFTADALGTVAGALLGTSTVTAYVESATGVEEGGRSGLTAVVVAVCFLLALFVTPLMASVPAVATAPALVVVGALMMRGVRDISWRRTEQALPAFLTISLMPLTYSIANGITFGLLAWVGIALLRGRWREVHPVLWLLTALLLAFYALR
ncbi:MAG: NCS2 family permease [Thermoanaerobaculia bacterium]|nr:NCS2 family permease [Thermoanaerobaculia bacterium]